MMMIVSPKYDDKHGRILTVLCFYSLFFLQRRNPLKSQLRFTSTVGGNLKRTALRRDRLFHTFANITVATKRAFNLLQHSSP